MEEKEEPIIVFEYKGYAVSSKREILKKGENNKYVKCNEENEIVKFLKKAIKPSKIYNFNPNYIVKSNEDDDIEK